MITGEYPPLQVVYISCPVALYYFRTWMGRIYNTFFLTNDNGIPLFAEAKATW